SFPGRICTSLPFRSLFERRPSASTRWKRRFARTPASSSITSVGCTRPSPFTGAMEILLTVGTRTDYAGRLVRRGPLLVPGTETKQCRKCNVFGAGAPWCAIDMQAQEVPRPPGDAPPGGFFHVWTRGNRRCNVFEDDTDYQVFLAMLAR